MKLKELKIHNIRSIQDAKINLSNYSMLVGENNAGKTNVITALRLFYEDGVKFKGEVDLPKFETDEDSWIELSFETTGPEQESLKEDYRTDDNILKVRKYFQSKDGLVQTSQSNIYAYENGVLSKNLFYGARNVSQVKLGKVIYIPAVNKTDETFKTSGPSLFRDMVNFVMKKAVLESNTFNGLKKAFDDFNADFKNEASKDGLSVNSLIEEINSEVSNWRVKFGISVNQASPDIIVKNLLSHYFEDSDLGGQQIDLSSFGQGLQRHLIFTLIKLSVKYRQQRVVKKKDFDPDFTLMLFDEPETFLHPSQQQVLHLNLRKLAEGETEQVLISSHSPHFVSKQILQIKRIVRVHKREDGVTDTYQLTDEGYKELIGQSMEFAQNMELGKKAYTSLGNSPLDESENLNKESWNFFLWLDSERASIFFAKKVIICEGATEKRYLDYLCDEKWPEKRDEHIYFLDSLGKYNIHRYITLLTAFGINHSVLMDGDENAGKHKIINKVIKGIKSTFTKKIHIFEKDLEKFLNIDFPKKKGYSKPLNVLVKHEKGEISQDRIDSLKELLDTL